MLASTSTGQSFSFQNDARSVGLAGTSSVLTGQWSGFSNPSGVAVIEHASAGLCYRSYYEIMELGTGAFSIAVPLKPGCFSATFSSSGFSGFREDKASACYGMKLGDKIRAGIGINWLHIGQPNDYTDLYGVVPSAGIQVLPFKNLVVGLAWFNPARQEFRPRGYLKLPSIALAGVGYNFGREVFICMEAAKQPGSKLRYSGGAEILPADKIIIRIGISKQEVTSYSAGIGCVLNHFGINIAVMHHPVLGFSPAMDLSYSL
jgi:hypothetical protein